MSSILKACVPWAVKENIYTLKEVDNIQVICKLADEDDPNFVPDALKMGGQGAKDPNV